MPTKNDDSAFKDVSKQQEQVQKDADKPAEFNDDGSLKVDTSSSDAARELSEEVGRRVSAQANGGGPWPEDVLKRNFISNATKLTRSAPEYTSHEEESETKSESKTEKASAKS